MFRDIDTQSPLMIFDEQVWPVLNRDHPVAEQVAPVIDDAVPFSPAPAAPDVPAAVGWLLFSVYIALVGALALATAGPGESRFMLVIAALFVVTFFAVPRFIFAQEPTNARRPTMSQFLATGLDTYTGHCPGGAAMVQMFVVPVLLTLGILLIALEIAWIG